MRLRNFYFQSSSGETQRSGLMPYVTTLFVGLFVFGLSFTGRAQAPAFDMPGPLALTVCQSSGATDISGMLTVTDPDVGDNLTWSEQTAPAHGNLAFGGTETSTGGSVMPSGITYMPMLGYSGSDMFEVTVSDGALTATIMINVTVTQNPSISVAGGASVCFGATTAAISYSTTTGFSYSGTADSYVVPEGVTSINFDITGAAGGADTGMAPMPGKGGRVEGTLAVSPGDELTIYVGGAGVMGSLTGAPGGYNGGGASNGFGGSGGGATNIMMGLTTVAVAGGGAGSGHDGMFASVAGGDGGGLDGSDGMINADGSGATGGSQIAGGMGATFATFANGDDGAAIFGGNGSVDGVSGGGGAGYYGGGGGVWCGGGGGSSYTDAGLVTGVTHTSGYSTGNGGVSVSYDVPAGYTYSIVWDAAAITAGFTDVTPTAFPSTSYFPVTVPATATPDTYNGTITISNGTCEQMSLISVTVKPIPDVNPTADQALCNGMMTTDAMFTGSLGGTVFNWTNDNTTTGLAAASGTGDILAFTATNTTADTTMSMIIVTPVLNSCFGTPDTFGVYVLPTPTLNSGVTGNVCNNSLFSYTATSATDGTSFSWSRGVLAGGITAAAASGSDGVISETFDNTSTEPIAVTYTYSMTAAGCENTQDLVVTVNPTPVIDPLLLLFGSICDGTTFTFTQGSTTAAPVSYSWSRAAVTGISNPDASDNGDISEVLLNTTTAPVTVTYIDTLHINGCMNTQSIVVTVNPTPKLSSSLTPPSVCNNVEFNYKAKSATAGTNFSWERFPIAGISSGYASGVDTIFETHTNSTDQPIGVEYIFMLDAAGCTNTQTVTALVNPTPVLNSSLTPAAICDSTFFDYDPGSNTTGATFAWSRAAVANITNPAASGTGNPNERLRNSASFPVAVTYVFTTSINGCSNAENVVVTVNPKPTISNTMPTPICDSTVFTFTPTSTTLGTAFTWTRPFVSGIGALAASGGPNVSELLKNNTNTNVTVKYIYTLNANGCSNTATIPVVVHPSPKMSSHLSDSACSSVPFVYAPKTDLTPSVTFAWTRAAVSGVTPTAGVGTDGINETLYNSTTTNANVEYVYTITVGASCSRTEKLAVTLRPSAAAPIIDVAPPTTLCNGTMYQNFGTTIPGAAGVTYTWSAVNAEIYATGNAGQYSIVNFNNPGVATVMLTSTIGTTGCIGVATYSVTVSSATSTMPTVIYTNGTFICLQNDVKNFQWGYDDATTLDSVVLKGEINQSYFNANPSLTTRHYWVMTNNGDCMKKSYYNKPDDNTPKVITNINDGAVEMKLFPNPATNNVTVEVLTSAQGTVQIEVTNMLGQIVNKISTETYKANISVSDLPAGIYVVDCFMNGAKIGTSKFVKN
jgi:hypothetical protein